MLLSNTQNMRDTKYALSSDGTEQTQGDGGYLARVLTYAGIQN
jgi:hypothetical protein